MKAFQHPVWYDADEDGFTNSFSINIVSFSTYLKQIYITHTHTHNQLITHLKGLWFWENPTLTLRSLRSHYFITTATEARDHNAWLSHYCPWATDLTSSRKTRQLCCGRFVKECSYAVRLWMQRVGIVERGGNKWISGEMEYEGDERVCSARRYVCCSKECVCGVTNCRRHTSH